MPPVQKDHHRRKLWVSDYRTEETLIRILISIDLFSNTISDRIVAEVI